MFALSGTALDAGVNTQGKICFYEADILVVMERYPSVEIGTHSPKQSNGAQRYLDMGTVFTWKGGTLAEKISADGSRGKISCSQRIRARNCKEPRVAPVWSS